MKLPLRMVSLFILLSFWNCKHDSLRSTDPIVEEQLAFTFLAHPYIEEQGVVNPQLFNKNWKEEGVLILGGDLDRKTTLNEETVIAYDEIFDFSSPTTLFTLGNHDYTNPDLILQYTERNNYYVHQSGPTCVFVADSQIEVAESQEQLDYFNQVIDTLINSKTFIFLSHRLIWMPGHPELEPQIEDVINGMFTDCTFCEGPTNFYDTVFPRLEELANKGIQVICLAGDLGVRMKYFEYDAAAGIKYVANGWNGNDVNNTYLEFYNTEDNQLRWEQVDIE